MQKQLRVAVSFRDENGFHQQRTWPIHPEMSRFEAEVHIQQQVHAFVQLLPAANFFAAEVTGFIYINVDENEFRAKPLRDVLTLSTSNITEAVVASLWRGIRCLDYKFTGEVPA